MHLKKRPAIHIDSYWTYDEWIHLVESSLGNINILLITSDYFYLVGDDALFNSIAVSVTY